MLETIEPGEVVTPPKPIVTPDPEQSTEDDGRGTSPADVVTPPKSFSGREYHADIEDFEGPYVITLNGTYATAGKEMVEDLKVQILPTLTPLLTATENGDYEPESPNVGFRKVTVAVPPTPAYEGSYTITENAVLPTNGKRMTADLTVNVPSQVPTLVTKNITANGVYNASSDNADGYSQVSVSVSSSDLPTLFAPALAFGTSLRPLSVIPQTNQNGAFATGCVITVNGTSKEFTGFSGEFSPWIYDMLPIAGGSISLSAKMVGAKFNDSNAATRTITFASATETSGYCSIEGLGTSTIDTQTYTYDSDFPRSFQEVQDTYGNTFIKIPTIYRKVVSSSNGQITGFRISTTQIDSTYEPYPCFVDETNSNAVLPYVLIGKWCVSNTSTANSVNATYTTMSMENGRTLCRDRGTGYQQYDWKFHKLFIDLGLIISRYVNINQGTTMSEIMGLYHLQQIEIWVDGLIRGCSEDETAWFACDAEASYQNAGGGTSTSTSVSEATILSHGYYKLSYTAPSANGYITKLGYDTAHPFLNLPNEATSGSQSTYYCDQYFRSSGSRPFNFYVGGANGGCGWFFCGMSSSWASTLSVRLCYRPILGATGYTE